MGKKSRLKKLKQESKPNNEQQENGREEVKTTGPRKSPIDENKESKKGRHYLGFIFVIAAIGITIYLLRTTLLGAQAAGCGPDSNCDDVLSSKYAYIGPIPVSLLALPLYIIIGLSHGLSLKGKRNLDLLGNASSILVVLSAIYFVGLQVFIIGSYCPYCIATHVFASVAGILVWKTKLAKSTTRSIKAVYGTAIMAWFLTITAQVFVGNEPDNPEPQLVGQKELSQHKQTIISTNSPSSNKKTRAERMVNTYGLDVEKMPIIGSEEADHIDIVLVDYTCKYCRNLHKTLTRITRQYPEKFAFIIAPMPLDAQCNTTLAARGFKTQKAHIEACEFAKLAMSLYRTDPKSFHWWDKEILDMPAFPKYQDALKLAKEITNTEKLVSYLLSPWTQKQIDISTSIYGSHYKKYGKGSMPQLIVKGRPQFTPFTGNRVQQILKMSYREDFITKP